VPASSPARTRPTFDSPPRPRRIGPYAVAGPPAPPWLWGAALATPLAVAYLVVAPPSGDLAAAAYRSQLFARVGFTVWDNGWYAGHSMPAYSLLAPSLGAALGVRELLALSALAAAVLFGVLAARMLPRVAARAATLAFAFGLCAELPSGRVPYDLGVAIGLAALVALTSPLRGSRGRALAVTLAIVLAVATSAASPVAGAFLALAALTLALSAAAVRTAPAAACAGRRPRLAGRVRHAALPIAVCIAALLPILALSLAFPEGGWEPFAAGAFWPELAAALAVAALLPGGTLGAGGRRTLRIGACLYALALAVSFLLKTPMGGNAVRLGALFGAPLLVAALWDGEIFVGALRGGRHTRGARALRGRLLLALLAPLLLYWQLASAIDDQIALAGDPTVQASFYAPLRAELLRLAHGRPIRVEVPLTGAHWESAYLPGGEISIARGWERQLDTRYDALFYERDLTAAAYRRWLQANAIAYVALPKARLDDAGREEARLVGARTSLPYLREAWRSRRWRLFAVLHPTPLAQAPAKMLSLGADSFALEAPRAGAYEVRLHWTPYWMPARPLSSGRGCVSRAPDGFTEVSTPRAGVVRVGIAFALPRVFSEAPRCAH
jgi:hypothetical protein